MQDIYLRNLPPPIETFDHVGFIEYLAKWIRPESYLEIGVRDGKCLKVIEKYATVCHAVDIQFNDIDYSSKVIKYEMKSDDFFSYHSKDLYFDLVFIDGDHSKEQVIRDFMNVSNKVVDDGFVILHDTYPCGVTYTQDEYCSNAFEAILFFKQTLIKNWEILTLPFHPGLTIMKKMNINKQVLWW